MRAIILAAGRGRRLRSLTNDKPKCLIEVGGRSILEWQFKNLIENGIKEIIVVAGYLIEQVEKICRKYDNSDVNIRLVNNVNYNSTNNMYSLFLAQTEVNSDFILTNGDVVFDSDIIAGILNSSHKNIIAVDIGNYDKESMKVVAKEGLIKDISKKISKANALGTSIDIYRFSKAGSNALFQNIKEFIIQQKRINEWTEVAIQSIVDEIDIYPLDIGNNRWIEIDDFADLQKAKEIFL